MEFLSDLCLMAKLYLGCVNGNVKDFHAKREIYHIARDAFAEKYNRNPYDVAVALNRFVRS